MVTSGVIKNNAKARLIRDGVVVYDGEINSVQREKDQAKEVKKGLECGRKSYISWFWNILC